jgi:hypothetical protein
MERAIAMELECCVLVVAFVALDEFPDANEHIDDLNLGRDASIKFVRQLADYVLGHREQLQASESS